LTAQIDNAAETIASNESSIARLQKLVQTGHKALAEKNQQLYELQNAKDSEIAKITSHYQNEKENLVQAYEKALTELRAQCDAHRSDLEKIAQEFADSESRNRRAKASILSLKREKMKLENELKALTETTNRDSQIAQAMIKNAQLTAESTASQKIQEAKAKFEDEKRRLFSVPAEEFRAFANAAAPIDERSYRALLGRVRNELKRLADSEAVVRRLVGAGPKQSTDDAIARWSMR
jgi:chromosome segregation ATPase